MKTINENYITMNHGLWNKWTILKNTWRSTFSDFSNGKITLELHNNWDLAYESWFMKQMDNFKEYLKVNV